MTKPIAERTLSWYSRMHPTRLDIVGDYAGSSRFLIHGDSLLRHCFSDPRLDFSSGFPLLHTVYVVERFFENLIRRGCVFDVVFLDLDRTACFPPGRKVHNLRWLLAREAIIRHLQALKGGAGETMRFSGMTDGSFLAWLDTRKPMFIMASDGDDIEVDSEEASFKRSRSGQPAKDWEMKLMLRRFMQVGEGMNIAILNQVEFVDSKMFTSVLERYHSSELHVPAQIRGIQQKILRVEPPPAYYSALDDSLSSTREKVTVMAISWMIRDPQQLTKNVTDSNFFTQASAFVLHIAYLNHLRLDERRLLHKPEDEEQQQSATFLKDFSNYARFILADERLEGSGDCCDLLDGTVLKWVGIHKRALYEVQEQYQNVPDQVQQDYRRLLGAIKTLAGIQTKGSRFVEVFSNDTATSNMYLPANDWLGSEYNPQHKLLPFSNPVFDPYLESIKLDIDTSVTETILQTRFTDQIYTEKTHWHNANKRLPELDGRGQPRFRVEARNLSGKGQGNIGQRYMIGRLHKGDQVQSSRMQKYAASLTNSVNGSLDPKLIILDKPHGRKGSVNENRKPNYSGGKNLKEKKAPAPTKSELVKQQNLEKTETKKTTTLRNSWNHLMQDLAGMANDSALFEIDANLKKLIELPPAESPENRDARAMIELDHRMYKLRTLHRMWNVRCMDGKKKNGYATVAALFDEVRRLSQSPALTVQCVRILRNIFDEFGIAMPPIRPGDLRKRKLGFEIGWEGKLVNPVKLDMTSEEFQLLYCGQYMDRNMDSKPDPRVPFEADGWQRKVLDEIDAENSVFVVAPTSAGKTFISFHAMEKVLKANDDGILVYVAPTKALVNQIAAEVISRFKKPYRHAGKTVWSIHTRDYRINNPHNCQILVTVPHILSIMLLAPSNAARWAPRVRRIIFDEVHSIGNAEDGVIWEQLLLLAPCPIIALSATVGNPGSFNQWLENTQKSRGIKLTMVQHPHRYSDLSKYIYIPSKETLETWKFNGFGPVETFGQLEDTEGMASMHPVTALTDVTHGIPDDLALEPRDCLRLYQALKRVETPEYSIPDDLSTEARFGNVGNVIKKVQVLEWAASLKEFLSTWMKDVKSPFQQALALLDNNVAKEHILDNDTSVIKLPDNESPERVPVGLLRGTLPLLNSLHSQGALPAIIFNYDRRMCETFCKVLCKELVEAEKEWRATDLQWKKTMDGWTEWKKVSSSRAARRSRASITELADGKVGQMREVAEQESSIYEHFNPNDPSPGFSFADPKKCSKAELLEELKWLTYLSPTLRIGLWRGIAVHHAGMSLKYRQCVEALFRRGYLRVVIATGTLALGINMPCKTVIFAGDSVFLSALNYRQASGRAGRRGFDLIGHVIFHNLPLTKARRLISSRLPSLMGHFPLSISLTLRLFTLLHNSGGSAHARNSIDSLMTQPRLVMGAQNFKDQVLHHLRFSIEFLRRQKLLAPDGTPLNFAGIASHLYYIETSGFGFHALLCEGYFSQLCEGIDDPKQQQRITRELMLVMSHLFGRRAAPRSEGIRMLPPLPSHAEKILRHSNEETLNTYSAYVQTFARQYCVEGSDNVLPFSKTTCGGQGLTSGVKTPDNPARSNFVALSGHSGEFTDIKDLLASVRSDIFLEGGSIPQFPLATDRLNSYLYSFYKDGDATKLERENGVRKSDVWFLLKDFSLVLATVGAGLLNYLRDEEDWMGVEAEEMDEDGEAVEGEDNEGYDVAEGVEIVEKEEYRKVLKAILMVKTIFEEKFKVIFS